MTPNQITTELHTIGARLRELFPESTIMEMALTSHGIKINLHNVGDYHAGTKLLRRIGMGKREKRIPDPEAKKTWSIIEGEKNGVTITVFCTGLPPSCRIDRIVESVPEMVETGKTITRIRNVVKCEGVEV